MNKDYETLYSRDSLGNIRIWKMEQNGSQYRTIAGLQNGEQVTSEWTVVEGKNLGKKNETSSIEQATKEIEVKYEELSPWLVKALIATEDKRYMFHSGIDGISLLRVFLKPLFLGKNAGGGSTITQQTAKNLFYAEGKPGRLSRIFKKPKEWIIAIQLERNFSKEEIIAIYFNTVFFNYNAYGIKAASHTYFNKSPKDLNVEEAALLVGMLKGPSYYNPKLRLEKSMERRNTVLRLMVANEAISDIVADSLTKSPIKLNFRSSNHDQGLATYFRDQLTLDLKAWLEKNPKPDGTKYNLYTDGLQIYTTIDSRMQAYAEDAVKIHLAKIQSQIFKEWNGKDPWLMGSRANPKLVENAIKKTGFYKDLINQGLSERQIEREINLKRNMTIFTYQGERDTMFSLIDSIKYYKKLMMCGFVVLEPSTGEVKAWVGGPNFTYFQLDHVRATKRQVGSTIKPLQYAVAIDNGMNPGSTVPYTCPNIEGNESWCPAGTNKWEEGAEVSLADGLRYSDNKVTAQLMKLFGPKALVEMAQKLGITSPLDPTPSLCLGTSDISVLEMAGAYTAFANKGIYTKPIYITRIEDRDGHVLEEFYPQRSHALSERTAYVTSIMLNGVVTGGTAARLGRYGFRCFIAGKTGTTQSNSDAWFVGFTPDLLGAVWVGADDPAVHASTSLGQGASAALPVWAEFFKRAYADKSLKLNWKASLKSPEGIFIDENGTVTDSNTLTENPLNQDFNE